MVGKKKGTERYINDVAVNFYFAYVSINLNLFIKLLFIPAFNFFCLLFLYSADILNFILKKNNMMGRSMHTYVLFKINFKIFLCTFYFINFIYD